MTKLTVTCRVLRRGTLVGLATIEIAEIQLVIGDVAIHEKALSRRALLPAKPQIRDDELVKDPLSGRVQYTHLMDFTSTRKRQVHRTLSRGRGVRRTCRTNSGSFTKGRAKTGGRK